MTALDQTVACAPHKAHLAVLRGQPQEVIPQIVLLTLPQLPYGHRKIPSSPGRRLSHGRASRDRVSLCDCRAHTCQYCAKHNGNIGTLLRLIKLPLCAALFRQDRRSGLGARNALVPFGIFDQQRPTSLYCAQAEC